MLTNREFSDRLVALGNHAHDGKPEDAFLARLDYLLPHDTIGTHDWALTKRKFLNADGEIIDYAPDLTPYTRGIELACDMPEVRVVAVKGNTRSGKTVAAENKVLKHWDVGPLHSVLWFMQDKDAISDYIDERGEAMLQIHEGVNDKIDWNDKRNSRTRKKIGHSLLLYRPATPASTRGKSAPIIVADEIDAYMKKVRDAIMGLVQNRQREYGNAAIAYFCSHPDAGPDGGIDTIIRDSLQHLWWMCCPHCGRSASPAAEAETRWNWNVGDLLGRYADLDRQSLYAMLYNEARIVCPHDGCGATFDNDERLQLSAGGVWLQPHQSLLEGVIEGEARREKQMGFVIHAFMAPFVNLGETARDWGAAKIAADLTGNDINLRERTVKDLGETYVGTRAEELTEKWQVVKTRLTSAYALKTVPEGVVVLTQFVDVQGDRFEVVVIGWSLNMESWLIDRYAMKQWPKLTEAEAKALGSRAHGAFENIDPANRLGDWDIIEHILWNRYPLVRQPGLFLPIAKTMVNAAGEAGVSNNARVWLANMLAREPGEGRLVEPYRVTLFGGAASKAGETYGKAKPKAFDDHGRPLKTQIFERLLNVHTIKKIVMRRMKIGEPGPGMMHLPSNLSSRYVRELVSEKLVNNEWTPHETRNETWDGWIACDAARELLQLNRPGLFDPLPDWARPAPLFDTIDAEARNPLSMFERLEQINRDVS
jgi:phage terminase large subunit GpA-like protein